MGEPTIRDVAARAQVSVASVSRAMNGANNVHPDTRARIADAAKALGYIPHAGARSLSLARSHAIGVVLPDLHGEFFSELVRGIDRAASEAGYHLLLSNIHADAVLAAQAMRTMRGRVDGLIVMAPQFGRALLDASLPGSLPSVLVATPDAGERASLRIDNAQGSAEMVRHLVATGRRRIVHVTGGQANLDARERSEAYLAALAEAGLEPPCEPVEGDFQEAAGLLAVRKLVTAGAGFDAIFAANDMMALGALQGLREAGLGVPHSVAVAGFDDIPLARYLGLTTVSLDIAGMGARAVERLVAALENKTGDGPAEERIGTTLAIRDTTGGKT